MNQGQQVLWSGPKGPTDGAEGCSFPQELEKARKAGYLSSCKYYYVSSFITTRKIGALWVAFI